MEGGDGTVTRDEIVDAYRRGRCDFSGVDMRGVDLHGVNLRGVNLYGVNLCGADLRRTSLSGTNMRCVNLTEADLTEASLHETDMHGANLSGAMGLLNPIDWVGENLEQTEEGVICYKVFGKHFTPAENWVIEPGSVIEEVVNPCPTIECGSGVNVATWSWISGYYTRYKAVWKCLIRWIWLAGVVVPYHTDGKFRASRVELVEVVEDL